MLRNSQNGEKNTEYRIQNTEAFAWKEERFDADGRVSRRCCATKPAAGRPLR
jgi:hypothetical protein